MNRAEAKRHIKNSTYGEPRGCRPYRLSSKAEESERIQQLTEEFFEQGGHIVEMDTQESKFRPTWAAYAAGAFESRGEL